MISISAMTTLFAGLSTLDIQYFVDEFPGSNTKTKTDEPQLLVGGPATNAAVANSFMGGKSVLLSGVGNSPFKDMFVKDFETCNIKHFDFYDGKEQLPVLASVITSKNSGDRNIFTYNPVTNGVNPDAVAIMNEIKPDQIFIDGFYSEVAVLLCKIAKENNIPVVFDGGSWKQQLPELLPYIDIAICSANFYPPACKTKQDVINFLKQTGIKKIAITNGAKEIYYEEENDHGKIKVSPVNVVDTLGAGDFFHGAFCFYNLQDNSFKEKLKQASVIASKSCEYPGTREWLKKLRKEAFLS